MLQIPTKIVVLRRISTADFSDGHGGSTRKPGSQEITAADPVFASSDSFLVSLSEECEIRGCPGLVAAAPRRVNRCQFVKFGSHFSNLIIVRGAGRGGAGREARGGRDPRSFGIRV